MKQIVLTKFGDTLFQPKGGKIREEDEIVGLAGLHKHCGGRMHLHPVSNDWQVLVCSKCFFRTHVPAEAKTYGRLAAYFAAVVMAMRRRTR